MKAKLAIIGAGGHGKVCADVAYLMNQWQEIIFLDNSKVGETVFGTFVKDSSDNWGLYRDSHEFFVAIGDNTIRERVQREFFANDAEFATLIHPSATIAREVEIAEGTLIAAGVAINPSTKIGKGAILNTACTIDHDSKVGDFVHISPGAHLAGTVSVGKRSWLGIGSIVKNNVTICDDVTIGAGGVVVKDINGSGIYVGVPVGRV